MLIKNFIKFVINKNLIVKNRKINYNDIIKNQEVINMKKFKSFIALMLGVSMSMSAFTFTYVQADESRQVVIYHTNDSHGYLQGDGESIVGIDTVAALKESTPGSVLVDAGDATQGLPLASLSMGVDIIELMNLAGYDLMAAGNHEFDFGVDNFIENVKKAKFPVLSANTYKDGNILLGGIQEGNNGCHTIIESNGIKIGFFGLTTVQTATATNPEGTKGVEFRDEIECAKREIDELNDEGADVIIAVCHMGNGDAPCTSTDLADAMTGEYQGELDAIIDGHSHTVENAVENDILIAQTGSGMGAVGKLTVDVSDEGVELTEERLTPADLTDVTPKAEVTEKLSEINESQQDLLNEPIGSTETTLWAGWIGDVAPVRFVETNYGDFAADALRNAALNFLEDKGVDMPVVAVENGGGIREAVPNGKITKGSLIATFPFSNTVYIKEVTPKILYEMMEVSGNLLDGQDPETGMLLQMKISGGFLQISGFNVVFDTESKDSRVISITLEGEDEPLDRNDETTKIMLAGNNYILSGGSDYTMLADLPKYGEAGGEVEAIQGYLESVLENGVLKGYEGTKNRIIMQGEYEPKEYTAYINVTDGSGSPLADQKVYYRVDGGDRISGTTDENGLLSIVLEDGPHGVRMEDDQTEVYINNYTGIGIIEDSIRKFPVLVYTGESEEDTETTTDTVTEATTETETVTATETETTTDTVTEATTETATETVTTTETETVTRHQTSGSSGAGGSLRVNQYDGTEATTEEKTETTTESTEEDNSYGVRITVGKSTISIGDEVIDTDCVPYIKDGSLMVPLRMAALAVYGLDIDNADSSSSVLWDANLKKATIIAGGRAVEFTADSNYIVIDGDMVIGSGAAAEIKNDRMYVPFRALGEALDTDVSWIGESKTAVFSIK